MTNEATRIRQRLEGLGLSAAAIDAAWPEWWSDDADPSPSARLELRFSLARKLGLDARSFVDEEGVPRFIWKDEARFKNLSGESDSERAAIASFGRAFGAILIGAVGRGQTVLPDNAAALRKLILRSQRSRSFVSLLDLLALSWTVGIPVVHLRVFPLPRKRMAAMSVRVGERSVILLGKDSTYPAPIAFYLAHELGHILLGHLSKETAIVDLEPKKLSLPVTDNEELEADQFALELLTGQKEPRVLPARGSYNAPGLADAVLREATNLQIEPGTLALCFGYSTGNWRVANSAMKFIYRSPTPVWREVNKLAVRELKPETLPHDTQPYLDTVLGSHKAA